MFVGSLKYNKHNNTHNWFRYILYVSIFYCSFSVPSCVVKFPFELEIERNEIEIQVKYISFERIDSSEISDFKCSLLYIWKLSRKTVQLCVYSCLLRKSHRRHLMSELDRRILYHWHWLSAPSKSMLKPGNFNVCIPLCPSSNLLSGVDTEIPFKVFRALFPRTGQFQGIYPQFNSREHSIKDLAIPFFLIRHLQSYISGSSLGLLDVFFEFFNKQTEKCSQQNSCTHSARQERQLFLYFRFVLVSSPRIVEKYWRKRVNIIHCVYNYFTDLRKMREESEKRRNKKKNR